MLPDAGHGQLKASGLERLTRWVRRSRSVGSFRIERKDEKTDDQSDGREDQAGLQDLLDLPCRPPMTPPASSGSICVRHAPVRCTGSANFVCTCKEV